MNFAAYPWRLNSYLHEEIGELPLSIKGHCRGLFEFIRINSLENTLLILDRKDMTNEFKRHYSLSDKCSEVKKKKKA